MSKIYLLTGAAGLLGSNISRQLIEKGETVRAFVLENDPAAKYIPEGAEIVYGDLCDVDSLERLFDVPEDSEVYVIHSASIVTLRPEPNPKVYAVNVGGTDYYVICGKATPVKSDERNSGAAPRPTSSTSEVARLHLSTY